MASNRQPINVTTRVKGWSQRSLFDSATLRPYRKDRYRAIRQRLAREKADVENHPTRVPARSPADTGE